MSVSLEASRFVSWYLAILRFSFSREFDLVRIDGLTSIFSD